MSKIILEAKTSGETVIETFNFISRLASSETISTAAVAAIVYSGTDASPASLISGTATISGQTVTQAVTGGVLGVVYKLTCTITTSLSQTLSVTGLLAVVPGTE
jgi:hypothetical protein